MRAYQQGPKVPQAQTDNRHLPPALPMGIIHISGDEQQRRGERIKKEPHRRKLWRTGRESKADIAKRS